MLAEQWRLDQSNLGRLVDLATDVARSERLRAITGGDTAALAELTMALQLLTTDPAHPEQLTGWRPGTCTHPDPDLDAIATVAWHRDRLKSRNPAIPDTLPAVWVKLGQPQRANNSALAIPEPGSQAAALTNVATALIQAGQLDHAIRVTEEARRVAAVIDPWSRPKALTDLVTA